MAQSAIELIMASITNSIPRQVLERTFTPSLYQVTLDERILNEIIRTRVLPDISLSTGKMKQIPLLDEYREDTSSPIYNTPLFTTTQSDVYRIPPEVRDNRDIVGVIRLMNAGIYGAMNAAPMYNGVFESYGNNLSSMSSYALKSHTLENSITVPKPYLLSDNMVRVTPRMYNVGGICLECLLAYDEEFTNIPYGLMRPLADLVLSATKAYIYIQLYITIDQAELIAGQALGTFKTVVESYADEVNTYQDKLKFFIGQSNYDPDLARQLVARML